MIAKRDWVRWSHLALYAFSGFAAHKIFPYVIGHTEFRQTGLDEAIVWVLQGSLIQIIAFIYLGLIVNLKCLSTRSPYFAVFVGALLGTAVSGLVYPSNGSWLLSSLLDMESLLADIVIGLLLLLFVVLPRVLSLFFTRLQR